LLTAVTVNISVMRDVTPCSVVECTDVSEDHTVFVNMLDDEGSRMLCTRRHIPVLLFSCVKDALPTPLVNVALDYV
jgi:hypothetical protein